MPFGRLALLFAWACCAFPVLAQPANQPQPGNPSGLTELELPARRQVVPPDIVNDPPPGYPPHAMPIGIVEQGPNAWFNVESLWWFSKPSKYPVPLVTSGSLSDSAPGVIGQKNTVIQAFPSDVSWGTFHGIRNNMGMWLDEEGVFGIENTFFLLEQRTWNQSFVSNSQTPYIVTIPFFDVASGGNNSMLNKLLDTTPFPLPPLSTEITVMTKHQVYGDDINLIKNISRDNCCSVDLLTGVRWLQVTDATILGQTTQNDYGGLIVPQLGYDAISTNNNFWGWQFGGRIREQWGKFMLESMVKIALGGSQQRVNISGANLTNNPAASGVFGGPGFVFSQPSNIGAYNFTRFAVLPEFGAKLAYNFNDNWNISVSYNFLYLSSVALSGNNFDKVTNPNVGLTPQAAPNGLHPAFLKQSQDYWVQGVGVGAEFRY